MPSGDAMESIPVLQLHVAISEAEPCVTIVALVVSDGELRFFSHFCENQLYRRAT